MSVEELRILPGTTIFRQFGGLAGTDEIQIYHDGSNGYLICELGTLFLQTSNGTVTIDTNGNIGAHNISGTSTGTNTGDQISGTGLVASGANPGTINIANTGVTGG